ncbi:hypothetical protein Tco_1204579 [Tanacetum coccineum]
MRHHEPPHATSIDQVFCLIIEMGDSSDKLNFTAEQLKFFLETCIDECAASGPNRQVYGKHNRTSSSSSHIPVNQVLHIEDVHIDEGGSSDPPPTNENHDADFDTGYDNDFEGGSPVPPPRSPSRARPKKKAKGGVSEFKEDMKRAIFNLAKGGFSNYKGPSANECHEKLKILGLESNDPLYLAAFLIFSQRGGNYRDTWMILCINASKQTFISVYHEILDQMLVLAQEVIQPTSFNPNPDIPRNNRRERRIFKGAVGALDGTLIHASVPFTQQHLYKARGRGTAHDARILNEALIDPEADFSMPPSDKYYLCDAAYRHTRGFMAPYQNVRTFVFGVLKARFPILKKMPSYPLVTQRDITLACFAIPNFILSERLSDEFFPLYDHREVHGSSNSQDDNVVDRDVQPYGSAADQEYMTSLRDSIAAQYP